MVRWAARQVRRGFVELRAALGSAVSGVIANRMRAFLSVLGIAIGVTTLVAIYATLQGLTAGFNRQIAALGANTFYVTSRPFIIRGDWWRYRNRPPVTRADVAALRRQGMLLQSIAPVSFAQADVSYRDQRLAFTQIRGTSDELINASTFKVDEGRFLTPLDIELASPVAVIGSEVKERLYHQMNPVGQRLFVRGQRFTVVGVLGSQGKAFGQSQDNLVLMPLDNFERIFGTRRGLAIAVTADPEKLNAAEEEIVEILRRERGLAAHQDDNFSINRQAQLARIFEEQTSVLFMVALLIGGISLIVGGIGVMNIMLVAVTERTREVGVRRALGARRRTILVQFLAESTMVTLMGGIVGVSGGILAAEIISKATPVAAEASAAGAALGLLMSAVVGLAFGTWPAYRAASLDPIESLRYE